jgi:hypothetical protein
VIKQEKVDLRTLVDDVLELCQPLVGASGPGCCGAASLSTPVMVILRQLLLQCRSPLQVSPTLLYGDMCARIRITLQPV